jgi:formylglycine-generating enzyme required for sulfatase activity
MNRSILPRRPPLVSHPLSRSPPPFPQYNPSVRPLALILVLAVVFSAPAAEPSPTQTWLLWDGAESIEQYARRAGLEPNKTLDLGNGVKLEMVLVPAGKFVMGTEEPKPVDEEAFRKEIEEDLPKKILLGQTAVGVSSAVLILFLVFLAIRAVRQSRPPQYSLRSFVLMAMVAGAGVLGGTHWWHSRKTLTETIQRRESAVAEFPAALARYKEADKTARLAHEVTLTKPYYIGKFEVTQEQYQQVLGRNPSHFKGLNLPVEMISWNDAQKFCKKASAESGQVVRLPTDAEWEHACRAGTRTTYYTGDAEADLDRAGWYEKNSNKMSHPVGQKVPNAWGIYDTHGNVIEWCGDWYEEYKAEATVDPQGPGQGQCRAQRGGSWNWSCRVCPSPRRDRSNPGSRVDYFGFRVAVGASRTP